ncbi:MAG: DNA-binding response regulator [Beggiatoa sp. IS2]|nr:MAG: DNA-binding response regulator [Beggiatoa sp. IS2]
MQLEPTIYIVDDDEDLRHSVCFLVELAGLTAKMCASANEFLQEYDPAKPGCLLVDVHMPGMSGLELQALLKTKQLSLPVIIITGNADVQMAVQAMKVGALDFIEKPLDNDLLLARIRDCINVSKNAYNQHLRQEESATRLASLTQREREVMELLVQGKLNKVIAADLGISPRTVEIHRANIMQKLQARSLSDVVKIALMH